MTKVRQPDTIEDALGQAIGCVGIDRIAGVIERSAAMVRKFADPDSEHHLQLRQAMRIDEALGMGEYEMPFAVLLAGHADRVRLRVRQLGIGLAEDAGRPLSEACRAVRDIGKLLAGIEQAEADGVVTQAERARLLAEVDAISLQLSRTRRALVARADAATLVARRRK